jgi:hypothetical protein
MYPTISIDLDPDLPATAQFWVPSASDLDDDEGFGLFRDVWPISDISIEEARELAANDHRLAHFTGSLAASAHEFDLIATAVETGSAEGIEGLSADQMAALTPYLTGVVALDGLEVGVAGLVYSLAAGGMYPAASCRGYSGPNVWSDHPIVFVALDKRHATLLQPLVRDSECGFSIDPRRPELLAIEGRSILDTMKLANSVLEHNGNFEA